MTDNLITLKGDGAVQDESAANAVAPNLEEDLKALGINPEDAATEDTDEVEDLTDVDDIAEDDDEADSPSDQDEEEPNEDQMRQDRAEAIRQAIKHSKDAEAARADVEYYKNYAKVVEDPNSLVDVHMANPELADRIAQERWGMSYRELTRSKETQPQQTQTPADIDRLVEQKLAERERASQKDKLEDYVVEYLSKTDVDPRSEIFKEIIKDYRLMSQAVSSVDQADRILNALYAQHIKDEPKKPSTRMTSVSVPGTKAGRNTNKSSSYRDAMAAAKALGMDLTEEDFKKFGSKR